ncbi:hypothetical protein HSRCO_0745 [Halanaeroarchaeum sp. HSR-CO]|uniref:hypothetical protein n=1 Tax=Halanaeroarchaeum sp. HSR-CO TaxID=2866382 RepID=UPI00217DF7C6|nr:hypothetical protein [Halanaeroarchaeum sp. HSR-CO]UWG47039.1 hypothetical protein HSRCO_0745 [Halanaeroarchaeum sp. HSR-CO]
MVDTEQYVDGSTIKWGALAATLVSSYLLAVFNGLADLLWALLSIPGRLLEDLLTWIAGMFGLAFSAPEHSIETAWTIAAETFPIAGPFDYAIGVAVVAVFFIAVNWLFGRVREGL